MVDQNQQPYCLVFGGGGAKGVYHIGVWQAIQEMKIPVNAFIGNSIGAVIASFLAQNEEEKLLNIARSINLQTLIRLHKDQALADEKSILDHSLIYWQGVYKNVVNNRGLDTTPMRTLLESSLDEDKIRKNGYDFGITTVNVSDFKPREVFIEQMEPGQLINYVMASAAFPGFSRPEINGKKYIDGGIYDNIPYTMARRRGYRRIILVDISGIGFNRRPRTEGSETVYIKNSIDMGNAFDFNPDFINRFWQLGYLDCMMAFGRLIGYRYFFDETDSSEQQKQQQYNLAAIKTVASKFPDIMKHDRRLWLKTLEVCAEFFDIERIKKYSFDEMEETINEQIRAIISDVEKTINRYQLERNAKSTDILDAYVKDIVESKKIKKNPFFVVRLINQFERSRALSLVESTIRRLNPEVSIVEAYCSIKGL
ncbi:MAG: patatin-like phospholipase family protein [Reinekea sp.]|jgi:NTE family protein